MKPVDNMAKLVKQLRYKAGAKARDRILVNVLHTLEESKQQRSTETQPDLWTIIMKSRITKLAAAAIITVAVLVNVNYFGGSVDGASVALGQTVEKMKKKLWLHQVATGTQNGKEVTNEQWVSFESKVFAFKLSDGPIGYHDYSKQELWEYDPRSKTISISRPKDKGDSIFLKLKSINSFLGTALEKLKKEGAKVIESSSTYNGNNVRVYEVSFLEHPAFKKTNIKFIVDSNSQLIIAEEVKATDENGNIIMEAKIKLDYPEAGPSSIYDLGVPSSAKSRGSKKSESAFEKAFNKAILTVDSCMNWPEPRDLVVAYWKARAEKNYEKMAIFWPGSDTWNRQVLENEEPVEYAFGEVESVEVEGHIIIPYASKSYYEKHAKYSLKMRLANKESTKGRYYIVSGN